MIKVIADPGSTHCGKLQYAEELIVKAREAGADAIKFQLFENKPPNIEFRKEWTERLLVLAEKAGIEIFFSVWTEENLQFLLDNDIYAVKLAYSTDRKLLQSPLIEEFVSIYISSDVMTFKNLALTGVRYLYCIPEYPVKYLVDFPEFRYKGSMGLFDGFSDHTMGTHQTIVAMQYGARIIEKHFTLDHCDSLQTPDGHFAVNFSQLKDICDYAHSSDRR